MKRLSDWAKEHNKTYMQAYRAFEKGEIDNAVKTNKGSIIIQDIVSPQVVQAQVVTQPIPKTVYGFNPVGEEGELDDKKVARAATRDNRAAYIEPINRFTNIENGFIPFQLGTGVQNTSCLDIKTVITLCRKAFYNFSIVRNVIHTMTELSTSNIYLIGGNKKVRDFFEAYFKKINMPDLQEKFFLEFFLSGNVFLYPMEVALNKTDMLKISQVFGSASDLQSDIKIPVRYIILNPAEIQISGSASFINPIYYKILTDYELQRLRSPQTQEDQEIYDGLPDAVKEQIKQKTPVVNLPLNSENIRVVFNKKSDFEPFAVPIIFGVLDDLEHKSELKKIDRAISRTTQQAVLLITLGMESKTGEYLYSQTTANAMQAIFTNSSVGRVLIADFTTKAEFVIPKIGEILSPEKYKIVEQDIKSGLNDILFGSSDEKFANQSTKLEVFIKRLDQARQTFLNNFLIPEIKKISKKMGFKTYPVPSFEKINIKDNSEWHRIITRLAELGMLSPPELFEAFDSQRLPTADESLESQRVYREQRNSGLYAPLISSDFQQEKLQKAQLKVQQDLASKNQENQLKLATVKQKSLSQPSGRPSGSQRPQSTKKVGKIGGSATQTFSLTKIKDNLILAAKLESEVVKNLKKRFKIKELSQEQGEIAGQIVTTIIANESNEQWLNKISQYLENPVDSNLKRVSEMQEISAEHEINDYLAAILLNSKYEQKLEQ